MNRDGFGFPARDGAPYTKTRLVGYPPGQAGSRGIVLGGSLAVQSCFLGNSIHMETAVLN